jgi:hypothetical protein
MVESVLIHTVSLAKLYEGATFPFGFLLLALNLMKAAVSSGTEDGG